jgi:uncharacterized protein (DUF697 family)
MSVSHLDVHRGLILSRSLVAGAAGMVPVPYLDDVLAGAVRAGLIRRLAELRQVDLDENAVAALATPRASRLLAAARVGTVALGARRLWRRVAASLIVVRRVDEAMQTFQVGTLFDHYCASHHVGFGLDGARAAELRGIMDGAIRSAHGEALERAFRGALRWPGTIALLLPRLVWSRLRQKGPIDPERLDENLRRVESSNVVQRAVRTLGSVGQGYARTLAASFDRAWAARS